MMDTRIWLIIALHTAPNCPVKYYVSLFPKSRGTFFKAKAELSARNVINNCNSKRGYLRLNVDEAIMFILTEYPGLRDLIDLSPSNRPRDRR